MNSPQQVREIARQRLGFSMGESFRRNRGAKSPGGDWVQSRAGYYLPQRRGGCPGSKNEAFVSAFGTLVSAFARLESAFGTPVSAFGTFVSTFAKLESAFGTFESAFGTPVSAFGTPVSAFGTPVSAFGTPVSAFARPKSASERAPRAIGARRRGKIGALRTRR